MTQTEAEIQRQKEIRQAEELLFTGRQEMGFAKGLFLGRFVADWTMPYPKFSAVQQAEVDQAIAEVRQFLDNKLDPVAIDRDANIPREIIDGLGRIGVLGMTAPKEVGGLLPRAGRNRGARRCDVGFYKCASFDWYSCLIALRYW